MTESNFSPGRAHHRNLVGFALRIVYANLTLSMDQGISIDSESPGLYTDAGLAAKMHSRHLSCRTIG
jgi:hypothetical protein